MNKKLMGVLGIAEEDTKPKDEMTEVKDRQEVTEATLDFILTEVLPFLMMADE